MRRPSSRFNTAGVVTGSRSSSFSRSTTCLNGTVRDISVARGSILDPCPAKSKREVDQPPAGRETAGALAGRDSEGWDSAGWVSLGRVAGPVALGAVALGPDAGREPA